jgi:hypothetical protein
MASFEQRVAAVKAAAGGQRATGEARERRAAQFFGQGVKGEELFPGSGASIREFLGFMAARRNPGLSTQHPHPGYLVGVVSVWPLQADITSLSGTIASGESYFSYAPTQRRIAQINSYALPLYLGVDGMFRSSKMVPFISTRTDASPYHIPNPGGVIQTEHTPWHEDYGDGDSEPFISYLRLLELEELLPLVAAEKTT